MISNIVEQLVKLKTRTRSHDFGVLSANKKKSCELSFPKLNGSLAPLPFEIDLLAKLGVIYLSTYRIVHRSKREWTGTSSRKRKLGGHPKSRFLFFFLETVGRYLSKGPLLSIEKQTFRDI